MIGSRVYTVSVSPGVIFNGSQVQAMVDHETAHIAIDEKLGEKFQPHALVHEVTHAILASGGWYKEDDKEQLVDYIAEHIVLFIRQNPHVVEYIQRTGKLDMEGKKNEIQNN